MSQHHLNVQFGDYQAAVCVGYDRPLGGFFMRVTVDVKSGPPIEEPDFDPEIYLSSAERNTSDMQMFFLCSGVETPAEVWRELEAERLGDRPTNRIVHWTGSEMTETVVS